MEIEHSEFHDQLVRGLAHKMNNILSLFHGYLSVIMENKRLDTDTRESLENIRAGASAASELLERTNSLARPTSLIWREIDLEPFLWNLKSSLDPMIPEDVELTLDVPENLPHILVDPGRLRTTIREVVKNACEAIPHKGTVSIHVVGQADAPAPTHAMQSLRWVSINIRDDGIGIPTNLREKIFQPFYSTRLRQSANGLGLTVALGLMQQLGGMLRFESEPGNTVFHLLLPSITQKF